MATLYKQPPAVFQQEPPKTAKDAELKAIAGEDVVAEQEKGAKRMEALFQVLGGTSYIWLFFGAVIIIYYVHSLASATSFAYVPLATSSYGQHAILGTIYTITDIASAVTTVMMAKICDLTSRATGFAVSLTFYVLGMVLMAGSNNVETFAAGQVFFAIGAAGVVIVSTILVGDCTPLQWRGTANSVVAAPWIINAYISGFITQGIGAVNWRWGYGMFAIMMPVVCAPAVCLLFYADYKAKRHGMLGISASSVQARAKYGATSTWGLIKAVVVQIDVLGFVLLGFAWALLLLPFTLSAGAAGGYKNPSLIAMFVVASILMISFFVWEIFLCPFPILPRRVLNKTFLICCLIDWNYFFAFYLGTTYWSSWVFVIYNTWSLYEWTAFGNTLTVGLCVFGIFWGLLMRATHRFKWVQVSCLGGYVLGYGLVYYTTQQNPSVVALAFSQIVLSAAGGGIVLCSQTAAQASVPHADLAIAAANLALWTRLGGAIGSAIATNRWTHEMPIKLSENLAGLLPEEEINLIYGSITIAASYSGEIRAGVVAAYNASVRPLVIGAMASAAVAMISACFVKNYVLDKRMNAVTDKVHPIYAEGRGDVKSGASSIDSPTGSHIPDRKTSA